MREIGYRTVDLLVEQLSDSSIPAMRRGDPAELRQRLSAPPPSAPRDWPEILHDVEEHVLGPMSRLAHRGYFAFIPASSTFAGALGDLIASALDIDVGSWMSAAGLQPLIVAANAGATNTGAVDPLPEIAEICTEHGLWLHVDAAYGGFAALSGRGRSALSGIELADSITLDPHKWLYQPIECGCLLVRV